MPFNEKQIEFMKSYGLLFDSSVNLSDLQFEWIEEAISKLLQEHGFDSEYRITEIGKMCESILDLI